LVFGVIAMRKIAVVALALAAGLIAGAPKAAFADLYTISNCSTGLGCGSGNDLGTITTKNITGGVEVSIQLTAGNFFQGTGNPSIMWSLSNNSSVQIDGVTNYTGYLPASGSILSAGSHSPDGIGTYTYGIVWGGCTSPPTATCNGAAKANPNQKLVFDLIAQGTNTLTTANFIPGTAVPAGITTSPLYFGLDLGRGCTVGDSGKLSCAATGFAGATLTAVPGPVLGAGLPGLIAACMGVVVFARRRRQRFA
jgi:hypothetical protein